MPPCLVARQGGGRLARAQLVARLWCAEARRALGAREAPEVRGGERKGAAPLSQRRPVDGRRRAPRPVQPGGGVSLVANARRAPQRLHVVRRGEAEDLRQQRGVAEHALRCHAASVQRVAR